MIENSDFINFFFIKKDSFLIASFLKTDLTCLYKNELILDKNEVDFEKKKIKKFIDNNIYKIEKYIKQFVKNINLVVYDEKFLTIDASIKKNIPGEFNFEKERLNLLSKIKNEIELNYNELSIIHLLVNNYLVDDIDINFKKNEDIIISKNFSIETKFILLPLKNIFEYRKIFANYQISVNKIISGQYLKDLSTLEQVNELEMALKIFLGDNSKEVILLSKSVENRGFFEKFFHLFS